MGVMCWPFIMSDANPIKTNGEEASLILVCHIRDHAWEHYNHSATLLVLAFICIPYT